MALLKHVALDVFTNTGVADNWRRCRLGYRFRRLASWGNHPKLCHVLTRFVDLSIRASAVICTIVVADPTLPLCITTEVGEWEIDHKALMIHSNLDIDFSDVQNDSNARGGDEEVVIDVS